MVVFIVVKMILFNFVIQKILNDMIQTQTGINSNLKEKGEEKNYVIVNQVVPVFNFTVVVKVVMIKV